MKKTVDIDIPSVPNYILSKDGKTKWHISEFTDEELVEIGKEWTDALRRKAAYHQNVPTE